MILQSPGVRSPGPYLPLACHVTPRKSLLVCVAESKLGAPGAWPAHSRLASVVSGALPGFLRQPPLPPPGAGAAGSQGLRRATACFTKRPPGRPRGQRWCPSSQPRLCHFVSRPSTQPSICGLELDCGAQLPGFMAPRSACKRVTNLCVCILACERVTSLVPISEVYGER